MDLPQELLDQILRHLDQYSGDVRSFSLVSRSWLECSRRLRFADISINSYNIQKFLDSVSPTNTALLAHVRSLAYTIRHSTYRVYNAVYSLEDYLPSLTQLQTLALCNMKIEPTIPERLDLFSAFQHTLSSLSLKGGSITWHSFVSLVGYFPNLRNLEISGCAVDDQPAPHPPRPLQGRLAIGSFSPLLSSRILLTGRLTELQLEYEEVNFAGRSWDHDTIIAAVQNTVKILTFETARDDLSFIRFQGPPLDLSHCPELQEIRFRARDLEQRAAELLPTITSINLKKISAFDILWKYLPSDPLWPKFDDLVCGLFDKLCLLGHQGTLEVEIESSDLMGTNITVVIEEFLPKFREKGTLTVWEGPTGQGLQLS